MMDFNSNLGLRGQGPPPPSIPTTCYSPFDPEWFNLPWVQFVIDLGYVACWANPTRTRLVLRYPTDNLPVGSVTKLVIKVG